MLKLEKSSVQGVICDSRLQQTAYTVKFTKLANMITLKRSVITQSQELLTAYTRPQVRIVSRNFSDCCNTKRNTTMNVNRSQKHAPILHYITQAKSKTTKITVMHHILTHFNSKSVKNSYFCIYFRCEKLTGNEIFLVCFNSFIHTDLPPGPNPRHPTISIMLNTVTNFHVHTAVSFSVVLIFW